MTLRTLPLQTEAVLLPADSLRLTTEIGYGIQNSEKFRFAIDSNSLLIYTNRQHPDNPNRKQVWQIPLEPLFKNFLSRLGPAEPTEGPIRTKTEMPLKNNPSQTFLSLPEQYPDLNITATPDAAWIDNPPITFLYNPTTINAGRPANVRPWTIQEHNNGKGRVRKFKHKELAIKAFLTAIREAKKETQG